VLPHLFDLGFSWDDVACAAHFGANGEVESSEPVVGLIVSFGLFVLLTMLLMGSDLIFN
jgi:hypothetical protein